MQFEVYKASGVTVAETDYEGTAVSYDEFQEVVDELEKANAKLEEKGRQIVSLQTQLSEAYAEE
jgi:hypothetical protein